MALAGTRSTRQPSQNLMQDLKERGEHQWVLQDICQRIEALTGKAPQQSVTGEWTWGSLVHLRTDIRWQDAKRAPWKWVQQLHPTPALGVYPREAQQWLAQQPEANCRARFGAPFGVQLDKDQSLYVVAIRNTQWDKDGCRLGSGCGVVEQSDLNKEWRELQLKRAGVIKILCL